MCKLIDTVREYEAIRRWEAGEKPSFSSDLSDFLTCGYGKLDEMGFWEFPLYPADKFLPSKVRKVYEDCQG